MVDYIWPVIAGTSTNQLFGANPGGYNPPGGHTGTDLGDAIGTRVLAPAAGTIIHAQPFTTQYGTDNAYWLTAGGGICVVLDCGPDNPKFTFCHLSQTLVKPGDVVAQGETIALSGDTGTMTSGPHLHFEALPPNFTFNPNTYGRVDPATYCTEYLTEAPPMSLNVIDISRYQAGMDVGATGADAVIVGLTYGSIGVNPYGADEVARTRNAGKLLGLYHIRAGDGPAPADEAQHFLDNATQYLDGRTIIFLDWEECTLSDIPWALAWCQYVFAKTGIMPVIYMSSSVSLAYDWSSVRNANIGLWVAQYPYNTVTGFVGAGWTPPATSWPFLVGWQYAGTGGSIGGYTGIDLSVFYLTASQWVAYGTPTSQGDWLAMATIDDVKNAVRAVLQERNLDTEGNQTSVLDMVAIIRSMVHDVPNQVMKFSVPWYGYNGVQPTTGRTTTTLGLSVGWSDTWNTGTKTAAASAGNAATAAVASAATATNAAIAALPAAVLNQQFTTPAGVTTNVPTLLNAINTKPGSVLNLTPDQVTQLAATLQAELPAATVAALAAQLATKPAP